MFVLLKTFPVLSILSGDKIYVLTTKMSFELTVVSDKRLHNQSGNRVICLT